MLANPPLESFNIKGNINHGKKFIVHIATLSPWQGFLYL
ncbi:Uncharacterised protein [Salmonella enterica]|uniref:Uncharacterized protein n=1 Tax=Salmonella enterica TaxID=28901 RepID=A0A379QL31_SALER|nr:Uncharacterised protein [Salmonella enterica]